MHRGKKKDMVECSLKTVRFQHNICVQNRRVWLYCSTSESTYDLERFCDKCPAADPGSLGPPCPQDFFLLNYAVFRQFLKGKTPSLRKLWAQGPPLGSKVHWAPLTKILDPRLMSVIHVEYWPFKHFPSFWTRRALKLASTMKVPWADERTRPPRSPGIFSSMGYFWLVIPHRTQNGLDESSFLIGSSTQDPDMSCRRCNKSSNFVLMTGKPVYTPMNRYIDHMRTTKIPRPLPRFSEKDIEVGKHCKTPNVTQDK